MEQSDEVLSISRGEAAALALSMYANEPCRICRQLLTMDDLRDGAKFAGYSADGRARAAHRVCWENFVEMVRDFTPEQLESIVNAKPAESVAAKIMVTIPVRTRGRR